MLIASRFSESCFSLISPLEFLLLLWLKDRCQIFLEIFLYTFPSSRSHLTDLRDFLMRQLRSVFYHKTEQWPGCMMHSLCSWVWKLNSNLNWEYEMVDSSIKIKNLLEARRMRSGSQTCTVWIDCAGKKQWLGHHLFSIDYFFPLILINSELMKSTQSTFRANKSNEYSTWILRFFICVLFFLFLSHKNKPKIKNKNMIPKIYFKIIFY